MPKPRLWHANPTETRDARASCEEIGPCSNPRPINQSGRILGFGLIADRPIGSIRAIHSHRRRTSRRIAPSNQSNQSFLRLFGRTNSIASISRWIVGGIPIGPMNATKGGAQPRTPTGLQGHRLPSHCYTSTSLVAQKSQTRPKPGCKPRRGLLLA